jgi:hypothetical protein
MASGKAKEESNKLFKHAATNMTVDSSQRGSIKDMYT